MLLVQGARMRYFCTYFDKGFLPRALALRESLARWCPEFQLWALCLDDESCAAVRRLNLPGFEAISLPELERADPDLLHAKQNRSRVEYYYTLSPALPLHVLGAHPEVELLTYLDADLFFYADPQPLFDELEGASVGIIPHRFSRRVADRACRGL